MTAQPIKLHLGLTRPDTGDKIELYLIHQKVTDMNENLKPRIYKFDNVRLLAIVLVVIGSFADDLTSHSDMFQSWFVFVYSFHAPLFIFLSGLFTKEYKDGVKPDNHRLSFYFGLGMILKIIIYLMRVWNGYDAELNFFGGGTIEWYLFVIVLYAVTMYLLRNVNRVLVLALSVVAGTAAGFIPLTDEYYLMRYLVFLPFFAAGYYLTPARVRRFTHQTNVKLAGIVFLFIYFVLCFREREAIYPLRMLFTGRNPYSLVHIEGCTFYHRLLCYGVSAVLIVAVMACMPNRKFPLVTRMGRNTLGVYFWHIPIVLLLRHYGAMEKLISLGDPLWKFVVLTISVIVALILAFPIFTWPLNKLLEWVRRMPPLACMTMDVVILMGAVVCTLIM